VKEIWQLATSPGILPATLLLIPILLYWIIGACGVFQLDLDGVDPTSLDTNGDGHTDHHDGPLANIMSGMMRLVNASDIPLMVVITLLVIFLWTCLMIAHHLFGTSPLPGWSLTLGAFTASLLLTRITTPPLRPFFRALKKDSELHVPIVGRTGVVRTHELTASHGQIEVPDPIGPMLLNARLKPGSPPLKKGDEVIIFEYDPERSLYFVKAIAPN
jgi:hypothetical protein